MLRVTQITERLADSKIKTENQRSWSTCTTHIVQLTTLEGRVRHGMSGHPHLQRLDVHSCVHGRCKKLAYSSTHL